MQRSIRPNGRFYLVGRDAGISRAREVRNGTRCGRLEGDWTFPDDPLVSKIQCQFAVAGGAVFVEDLGSTNRTLVNSVPLQKGRRRPLRLQDVVEFGGQCFVLTDRPDEKVSPSPSASVRTATRRALRVLPREDGGFTRFQTGMVTRRTAVWIGKARFRRHQAVRVLSRVAPPTAARGRIRLAVGVGFLLGVIFLGWNLGIHQDGAKIRLSQTALAR